LFTNLAPTVTAQGKPLCSNLGRHRIECALTIRSSRTRFAASALLPDLLPHRSPTVVAAGRLKETFSRYDTADYLETEADIAAYLTACAEEDDPTLLVAALGDVARARNMTQLAEKTGMTRMGLYKALSGQGNPSFATVSKVAHALGLKITVAAV
jgi:probable addiction module antidote protein